MRHLLTKTILRGILTIALICSGFAAAADKPRAGLLWNKTGLPLVFPLIVTSAAGRDFYVLLTHAETGAPAMAAFLHGGDRLQVLAPPGTYLLEFATGPAWKDEEILFGEGQTTWFAMDAPLTFEITGRSTKKGYTVDITGIVDTSNPQVTYEEARICQGRTPSASQPRPRQVLRAPTPRDPVGQKLLERRFERGENAYELYDRERQQRNYDPPVLGAPAVPLARPSDDPVQRQAPVTKTGSRIYEWPC